MKCAKEQCTGYIAVGKRETSRSGKTIQEGRINCSGCPLNGTPITAEGRTEDEIAGNLFAEFRKRRRDYLRPAPEPISGTQVESKNRVL